MADSAATLNCPMCGASARTDASHCEHCGARLATVACPVCFGMIFKGSKFCSHCGAKAERIEEEVSAFGCPHCNEPLRYLRLGRIEVSECQKCDGLWLDKDSFEDLITDREQQAAVLGTAVPISMTVMENKVRYIKCPVCGVLMSRTNFSGCSGVVIDVCREHGTWFDANELQRIIAFIRGGGMERARERQKQELEEARRRLEDERRRAREEYTRDYDYSPCHDGAIGSVIASLLGLH